MILMAASKAFVQSFGCYKKEDTEHCEQACKEVERCRLLIRYNRCNCQQIYQEEKSYKNEDSELASWEVEHWCAEI